MRPQLANALNPQPYEDLPEFIRADYSPVEWLWLSDREKATLVQSETEPETFAEDWRIDE